MIKVGANTSCKDQKDVIKIMSTVNLFMAITKNVTDKLLQYFSPKYIKTVLSIHQDIIY